MDTYRSSYLLPQVNALVSETSMLSLEDTDDQDDLMTDENDVQIDGLGDIWMEMTLALESSKDVARNVIDQTNDGSEECVHTFVLKEDLGFVCSLCGVIDKSIENIFAYQWMKGLGSGPFRRSEPWSVMAIGSEGAR